MDRAISITESVRWVGVNDRTTGLFEGLWPLPRGVSYNSYLIRDEKTALVDTVKQTSFDQYYTKLRGALGADGTIDFLVVNHMEPDHSGSIKILLELYPDMKLIGNKKTANFLEKFYGITSNMQVVEDGEGLSLGRHQLKFFFAPMVHWPESMATYDETEKILFSNDAFGGFGTLDGGIFDDEVDIAYFEDEILRYFSNIIGKYCAPARKAIEKLKALDIAMVAPSHGPIWRKDPRGIIERYDRWSNHEAEEGVVIAYASMYRNTERMMEAVARGLSAEEVSRIRIHNAATSHLSYLIRDAWRFKALVLGSPTYDASLFPPMDHFIRILQHKKLTKRVLGLFGTYGWSGGGVSTLTEFAQSGGWDLVEPIVEANCAPTADDLARCEKLGQNVVRRLKTTS